MIKLTLKVMLAKREMTQKQLSEVTGIRPPTVSAIATNRIREIPVAALDKICAALDCQPGDFVEYIREQ